MMKALTVQQPWAWAIMHGRKAVENRKNVWGYRGPLAIHAGLQYSDSGTKSPLVGDAFRRYYPGGGAHNGGRVPHGAFVLGAFIGVVDLVDIHYARSCCGPWGEDSEPGTRAVTHLVLENPRPIALPIPARGALGLWTPDPYDAEILAQRAGLV